MITKQLHELHPWDKNARGISKDGLERLKKQITQLGQYKPLLVTSDGTILGGNMRYKAMLELGITEVKCIIVEFMKEDDGFIAVVEGEPQRTKFYQTVEDAMMEYSLSDNDRAGYYDHEELLKIMPEFNVEWKEYSVDFFRPVDIPMSMTKAVAPDLFDKTSYLITVEAQSEEEQKAQIEKLKELGFKVKEKRKK